MSNVNTAFIKKAQQLLQNKGFEIKTSQLYEIFSELSGYKNYNVAKAKKVNFEKSLEITSNAQDLEKLQLSISQELYVPLHERIIKKLQKSALDKKNGIDLWYSIELEPERHLKLSHKIKEEIEKLESKGFHFFLKKMYKNGIYSQSEFEKSSIHISFSRNYKYILSENIVVKVSSEEASNHIIKYLKSVE